MSKKQSLLLTVGVMLLIFAAVYLTNNYDISNAETAPRPTVVQGQDVNGEERVIDFTIHDLYGNAVSLSDYEGKVVFLNFWATWCKWCKKEMPDMEKMQQEYKDKGLVILAVSIGEETETVRQFIDEHDYTFNVLLDPDKTVAQAFQVKPIPVSIFIDTAGNIVYRKLGTMKEEQMREQIEALLQL